MTRNDNSFTGPGGSEEQGTFPGPADFGDRPGGAASRLREHLPYGLRRPQSGRILAGVAAGLAAAFDLDVTIVRLGIAVLALTGIGVPLYIAAWLIIPEEGAEASVLEDLVDRPRAA